MSHTGEEHVTTAHDAAHHLFSVVPEVNVVHLVLTFLAVFILVFGMISALIKEKLYIGEAIVATAFGIIFGPHAANLIDPRSWGSPSFDDITLEFTRVVLALSVFAVGVELPRAYVKRHWRSLIMVLGPLMIAGWLITGGLIYALVPRLSFLGALVIAACATPTDPILAASVVGKAAFPFLYLALFLIYREDRSVGHAVGMWIVLVILYQITLGIIIGIAVGIAARKLLKFSKRRELIDRESMVAMYVSLAIFTTAATTLAGSDDLLAAFACGAAFAWDDWFSESIEDSNFSNIIDLLINCATFIYIGATMPFDDFQNAELTLSAWKLAVLGIAVLLVRRLPVMLMIYKFIPDIKTFREAVFAGWFGPITGVGAIFIATLALSKLPTPTVPPETADDILALTIQPVVYFLVLCSIIAHGSSIPFFNLGKRVHSISRTWTNRSENEPSWLSRVKRAGDGNVEVNRDDTSDEKQAEKRRMNGEQDIEAGDRAFDDPGMDFGDVSARDFAMVNSRSGSSATRQGSGSGSGEKLSPTGSDRTAAGSGEVSGTDKHHKSAKEDRDPEKAVTRDHNKRLERHDSNSSDSEAVWEEGDDVVIERDHGEDVEVQHSPSHEHTSNGAQHRGTSGGGPGFPGHRFAEIEHMLESGEAFVQNHAPSASPNKKEHSKQESKPETREGSIKDNASEKSFLSPNRQARSGGLMQAATERVVNEQRAEEAGVAAAPMTKAEAESNHASSPKKASKGKEAAAQQAGQSDEQAESSAASPPQPVRLMSAQGLAQMTGFGRPRPKRQPSLTPEEKYARDAWCRKERHDVDDDEVKTWISGRHIIIERKNGEEVEIQDVNPSKEAREKAKNDPKATLREVPIKDIKNAEANIVRESSNRQGPAGSSAAPPQSTKKFDLMGLRQNHSFRKFFGAETSEEGPASSSKSSDAAQHQAGPSRAQPIPTIRETGPEDEADAPAASSAEDSPPAETPGGIRFGDDVAPGRPANQQPEGGPSDGPNYLSTRKTGIPVERTETTDSQVRFGKLPRPSKKK